MPNRGQRPVQVVPAVVADAARASQPLHLAGPVTWDRFEDRTGPGGAVAYAARVAGSLGIRASVTVLGGADAALDVFAGHDITNCGAATLTYEHRFEGRLRHMRLVQAPGRTMGPGDLAGGWQRARTLVLAPLVPDDMDVPAIVRASGAEEIALLAQGLQRRIREDGAVDIAEEPAGALLAAVNERVSVFVSADEVTRWPSGALAGLSDWARRVVITHGREGVEIWSGGGWWHAPALAAERVDPTGAGDAFATAFILAVRAGEAVAARVASAYAAANIARPGPAALPPWSTIAASLDGGRPGSIEGESHIDGGEQQQTSGAMKGSR